MKSELNKNPKKQVIVKIIITIANVTLSIGMISTCLEEVLHPDPMAINAFFNFFPLILNIVLLGYSIIQIKNIIKKKFEITTIDEITSIYLIGFVIYAIFFALFWFRMK